MQYITDCSLYNRAKSASPHMQQSAFQQMPFSSSPMMRGPHVISVNHSRTPTQGHSLNANPAGSPTMSFDDFDAEARTLNAIIEKQAHFPATESSRYGLPKDVQMEGVAESKGQSDGKQRPSSKAGGQPEVGETMAGIPEVPETPAAGTEDLGANQDPQRHVQEETQVSPEADLETDDEDADSSGSDNEMDTEMIE